MARLLLEHGAAPNPAPEASGPALLHARRHPELKALLLAYGAEEDTSPRAILEAAIEDDDLGTHPDLVHDQKLFWGEGILAVPANRARREMIELLVERGARVPEHSKWGPNTTPSFPLFSPCFSRKASLPTAPTGKALRCSTTWQSKAT